MVGFAAYQSFMYVSTKREIILWSATESHTRPLPLLPAARWPSAACARVDQSRP